MTNYRRGYEFERQIKKILENKNYFVMRSSGSHTLFDLIAVNKFEIKLIQAKRVKKLSNVSITKELAKLEQFTNFPTNAQRELWIKIDKVGISIYRLNKHNSIDVEEVTLSK
jgi:Holliday junction resolvase